MTEAEWIASEDLGEMVRSLRGKTTMRRRLLFGCGYVAAFYRDFLPLYPALAAALEVCERYADGEADEDEYKDAAVYASWPPKDADEEGAGAWSERNAMGRQLLSWLRRPWDLAVNTSPPEAIPILRDVFRPFPHSPGEASLAWEDRTAYKLADAIYRERAFDRLPILGDALEEAGCTDTAILDHLHGPDSHTRGCWALDLVLGKA